MSVLRHVVESVRAETWRQALEDARGNISVAARAVGVSRRHASKLTRTFDLVDFARALRAKHWNRRGGMGRPPGKGS